MRVVSGGSGAKYLSSSDPDKVHDGRGKSMNFASESCSGWKDLIPNSGGNRCWNLSAFHRSGLVQNLRWGI